MEGRCRQSRHVQRLTDVAGVLRAIFMLVKEAPARSKVQQQGASQHRQRLAHDGPSEDGSTRLHHSLP